MTKRLLENIIAYSIAAIQCGNIMFIPIGIGFIIGALFFGIISYFV